MSAKRKGFCPFQQMLAKKGGAFDNALKSQKYSKKVVRMGGRGDLRFADTTANSKFFIHLSLVVM